MEVRRIVPEAPILTVVKEISGSKLGHLTVAYDAKVCIFECLDPGEYERPHILIENALRFNLKSAKDPRRCTWTFLDL
jgi:hypothetical protein